MTPDEFITRVREIVYDAGCQEWCCGIGDSGSQMPQCDLCDLRTLLADYGQ